MICNQCKSRNPIGSKFCRECGIALPLPESPLALEEAERAERERLNERVAGLLSAAYTLAEQRRYDQALPLAEEAANLLPNSTAALSLLATLYEYAGEDEKAIKAMERVVALNPESPGDRQKLGQLRRAVQEAQSDDPFPHRASSSATPAAAGANTTRRASVPATASESVVVATIRRAPWIPYVLGGATAACALGLGFAVMGSHRHEPSTGGAGGERASGASVAGDLASVSAAVTTPAPQPVAAATPFSPLGLATYGTAGGDPFASSQPTPRPRYRPEVNNSLPAGGYNNAPQRYTVYNNDTPQQTSLPPIIAVPPTANNGGSGNGNALGADQSAGGFGNGGRITVGPPSGNIAAVTDSATATPQGIIRITVGKAPNGAAATGSASSASQAPSVASGPSTALSRARGLQAEKHYADAITAYHDAINLDGGVSATAQEHIAQCEAAQGHDADARSAYREALHDYQEQLSQGRGVRDAQAGINTCKAALEALGGA